MVRLQTASGQVVLRRSGRIGSADCDVRYFQYCIESSSTAAVYHVFNGDMRPQRAAAVVSKRKQQQEQEEQGGNQQANSKSSSPSLGAAEPRSDDSKRQKTKAGGGALALAAALSVTACVIYIALVLVPTPAHPPQQAAAKEPSKSKCGTTNLWDSKPPITSCQAELNAFCNSDANAECIKSTVRAYGNASLPMIALDDLGLGNGNGSGKEMWRCYSALSVKDGQRRWDGTSPGYCSEDHVNLARIWDKCGTTTGAKDGLPLPLPSPSTPQCREYLARGFLNCSDFDFGGRFPGGCNLACGFNAFDITVSAAARAASAASAASVDRDSDGNPVRGPSRSSSCDAIIAGGSHTCDVDFAPGGMLAASCDFACGYCTQPNVSRQPPPPPPSGSVCLTVDALDERDGSVGNCYNAIASGAQSCADFAHGGGHERDCDWTCGLNTYDSKFGAGSCAKLLETGQFSCELDFEPGGQYAGYCDFVCGNCVPPYLFGSGTCRAANRLPYGLCDAYVNYPDAFSCADDFANGGRFAGWCDRSCGFDYYDAVSGAGQCSQAIAAGIASCAVDFAEGGQYAVYCDYTCGFCAPPPPPHNDPLCNERATSCFMDQECSLITANPVNDISVCTSNTLCKDFLSCYHNDTRLP